MVISTSVTTEMMIAPRAITATSPSQFIKGRPLQIARTLRPLPTRLKQQLGRIKDLAAPALSTRELKLGVLSAEKANSIFCLIKYRILLPLISVATQSIFFNDLSDRTVTPSGGSGFVTVKLDELRQHVPVGLRGSLQFVCWDCGGGFDRVGHGRAFAAYNFCPGIAPRQAPN